MAASRQESNVPPMPLRPPVVAMNEMVRGWFNGLPRGCAVCGGRLTLTPPLDCTLGSVSCLLCGREAAEVITARRPRPSFADMPARRGRPPGSDIRPRVYRTHACADCGIAQIQMHRLRCQSCSRRLRSMSAHAFHLVELLGDGRTVPKPDLRIALGVTEDALRHVIKRARHDGYTLLVQRGTVRLVTGQEQAS